MHIAVVSLGAFGHVNPTLELVTELVRRGVRVTYFCTEGFRTIVEPTGAQFVAVPSWMEAHAGESGEDKSDVAATVPFLFLHEAEAYLEPVLAVLKEDRPRRHRPRFCGHCRYPGRRCAGSAQRYALHQLPGQRGVLGGGPGSRRCPPTIPCGWPPTNWPIALWYSTAAAR